MALPPRAAALIALLTAACGGEAPPDAAVPPPDASVDGGGMEDAGTDAGRSDASTDARVPSDAGADAGGPVTWPSTDPGPYGIGWRELSTTYTDANGDPRTLRIEVWYPTEDTSGTPARYLDMFDRSDVFVDASLAPEPDAGPFPLLVYSHGRAGAPVASWFLTEFFATHGFIVAAPEHTGDTSPAPVSFEIFHQRPTDISATLDALESLPAGHPLGTVSTERVAVAGHSFGGYTAMAAGGATFAVDRMIAECALGAHPSHWCDAITMRESIFRAGFRDPRIDVLVPMAPGTAAMISPGARDLSVPTLLMSAARDRTNTEAVDQNPMWVAMDETEDLRLRMLTGGHYTFAVTCEVFPSIGAGDGCGSGFIPFVDAYRIIDAYALAYVRRHMLGDETDAALLDGTTTLSSDVELLRHGTSTTSDEIVAARGRDLPQTINGAVVTYTRATIGGDPAGFFVQAEQLGPALFVEVDPSTLSPAPTPGDVVTFTVDAMTLVEGRTIATAISAFSVDSSGFDVSTLVQDVSGATDLVTHMFDYQSELVTGGISIQTVFASSGAGFVAAWCDTASSVGESRLRVRMPQAERDALLIHRGCSMDVGPSPLWRRTNRIYFNAWVREDLSAFSCSPPTIFDTVATSATEVVVTFDREMDPAAITSPSAQFTIPGLSVSAASVTGPRITLTTSPQTPGMTYTLSVAGTVLDALGAGPMSPDDMDDFIGYEVAPVLQINELSPGIAEGGGRNCDLIELRVVSGGQLRDFALQARGSTSAPYPIITFPAMTVATNDLIVVHLDASDCNETSATPETTTPDAAPNASHPRNYDGAYDLYATGGGDGLTAHDNTIRLLDRTGAIADIVPFVATSDCTGFPIAASSERWLAPAAGTGWLTTSGTVPAGGFVGLDFCVHAAADVSLTGPMASSRSLARADDVDSDDRSDWSDAAASTFGALNGGQSPF